MKRKSLLLTIFIALQAFSVNLFSQWPANYQYTLLPQKMTDLILAYSSGEAAMKHITDLAPYSRPRTQGEFRNGTSEISYITGKLSELKTGIFSVDSVGETNVWRAIEGSVYEVSPGFSKVADIGDVTEMLTEGSKSVSGLRAKLIWAGDGDAAFFQENKNSLKGKVLLTSGNPYMVHARAMNAGAAGTISFFSQRVMADPVQIPLIENSSGGFLFMLPPREGLLLRDRLFHRESIEVEVNIKSREERTATRVVQYLIPGRDTSAGEIIITAHLLEGYVKMGANDNISGSAVILEVARLLDRIISEGKADKPLKSIRFLWVPEFEGTIPWVNSHLPLVKNALCDINLDMAGLKLRENKAFYCLNRSGYSTSNFANDVMETLFRYVGETNVEGITDYLGRRGFSKRIVAPSGSDDPFYYRVLSLHGSSDNAVFNDWGISVPGLKMITWPDLYYHSSQDLPDKCDATQLRRAVFITACGAYTIGWADAQGSLRILAEMFPSAQRRIAMQMSKAQDMIWNSGKESIAAVYKRAVWNIEGTVLGEKASLARINRLSDDPAVTAMASANQVLLDKVADTDLGALKEIMVSRCKYFGIPPVALKQNDDEKKASHTVPVKTTRALTMGYNGEAKYLSGISEDFATGHTYKEIVNADEIAGLADGKRNILQIKKIVDSQFEKESPLQDILNYFATLREAGLVTY